MATNTQNFNLKKPASSDFVQIDDLNENCDKIDAALHDTQESTVTFAQASEDADIASGDTHATLFGKIKKRFAVLATNIAAKLDSSKVSNSRAVTEAGFALDARQGNAAVPGTMAADISSLNSALENGVNTPAIGKNKYIDYPEDGIADFASTQTGYLKITLPVSWNNSMLKFKVSIFNYQEASSCDYFVSGYLYTDGSWYSPTAYSIGSHGNTSIGNLPVRFGHDGSKCCVYIGEANTLWNNSTISVSDVSIGFYNYDFNTWKSGWNISITPTLGVVTRTVNNPFMVNIAIQGTAPSNTSALWIDTSSMKAKVFISGAWAALS